MTRGGRDVGTILGKKGRGGWCYLGYSELAWHLEGQEASRGGVGQGMVMRRGGTVRDMLVQQRQRRGRVEKRKRWLRWPLGSGCWDEGPESRCRSSLALHILSALSHSAEGGGSHSCSPRTPEISVYLALLG